MIETLVDGSGGTVGQQFGSSKHHLWKFEHIHIREADLQRWAAGVQCRDKAEGAVKSSHARGMQADALASTAVDTGKPFANGVAGIVTVRPCWTVFFP